MKIKAELIKKMRIEKGWSQESLCEKSGLSLRTIQRIESGSNVSIETMKILAATFEISLEQLIEKEEDIPVIKTPLAAVRHGFEQYANFSGKASRYEYWWFFLFIILVMAIATIIHEKVGMIVDLVLLIPLLSAGTRRLNDAGESPWWQILIFVPFGIFVLPFIMTKPSKTIQKPE